MCSSSKVRYNTRKQAKKKARERSKKHKIKLSVYKCKECDGYHLTSINMKHKIRVRKNRGATHD